MEVLPVLILLALLFALIAVPITILVKLSRIAGRLDVIEKHLASKQSPVVQQKVVVPSAPAAPVVPTPAPVAPPLPEITPQPEAPPTSPAPVVPAEPTKLEKAMESLEARTAEVFRKVWNFLAVGEEYRNPAVTREYAVATTWLIRIGIITLLCGIGFFLKYSIDHGWLNPAVRVAMMVVAGLAMAGVGVWKSEGKYRPFMVALAGAGFVTLYLSIMAAFRLYHLVPGTLAFAFMVAVTVAAMVTALGMNALLPALLGCVGGFLTPYFIETGSHDLAKFFLYMTMLTAGTLFTAHYRSWILLHLSAFILYALLGGAAISSYLMQSYVPTLLITLSINFAFFGLMAIGTARRRDATLWELLLLLANAAFYFFMAVPLAQKYYAEWKIAAILPLFAAALGVAESLFAVHKIDGKRPYLQMFLSAQAAFSLALVVPLLFGGAWIIAAWSVLAYLMLRMGIKAKSRILLLMSVILYIVTQIELFRRGMLMASFESYGVMLFHHLLSAGILTASWVAASALLFRARDFSWVNTWSNVKLPKLQNNAAILFAVIAGISFLAFSSYEWRLCMKEYCPVFSKGVLVFWWSILMGAALVFYRKRPALTLLLPVLIVLSTLSLAVIFRMDYPHGEYWKHLLLVLATRGAYVASLTAAGVELYRSHAPQRVTASVFSLAGALFFLFSSQEIFVMLKQFLYGFRNGGVSVWWSLCAMALLAGGIRWRQKVLRILGVLLFVVCAVKVFIIDLAHLEQIWRITAFAAIGVFMLLGAVLYIRFKDIFAAEKKDN